MFKNYLKIAWRNLVRNKSFSAINIMGLALGMTCSLLIMLWVMDEKAVDGFHANGKKLFQVYERSFFDGKVEANFSTQGLLATELKRKIPEIEFSSGIEYVAQSGTSNTFEAANKIIKLEGRFVGEDFFKMFSFPLLRGNADATLKNPGDIAISDKMARLFFDSPENALGKTIKFENQEDLRITAVFENMHSNSSMQYDFLRTWPDFIKQNTWVNNWGNTDPATIIQLRDNADPVQTEAKIKNFIANYKEQSKKFLTELALISFPEKYLHSNFKNGYIEGGRVEYVRLFSLVAVFILLIACINFMNLATARSAKRAKEIGVRKVVGAIRSSLVAQFISEALLITFLSVVLAIVMAIVFLPGFNQLTGKQLTIPVTQPIFWLILTGIFLLTGLVAGSYPALFLSSLNPIRVLKGSLKFKGSDVLLRKSLVVFQFGLSILLITAMLVIYRQLNYIQSKNLGYDRENLVYLPVEGELANKYKLFKEEAGKIPGILAISKIRAAPTAIYNHTGEISWVGKNPNTIASFVNTDVGYDFIKTMHLQLAAGRDFSADFGTDSASFIINETAVQKTGYKDPLGKRMWWGKHEGKIIAVLKDFHTNTMHETIEPFIMRLNEGRQSGTILVRTTAGKTKEAMVSLEKVCKALNPKFPFSYQFSDEEFTKLYQSEEVVGKLSNYFAFLAIFISCLGLFGLATFTAEQRTHEIGVRKVLGASVGNIVSLLSVNFLQPVAMAMLIAVPAAWYTMNLWLRDFAYKITIEWWMFAIAGGITVMIALLTVSYQSIRAALNNPVKCLRTE